MLFMLPPDDKAHPALYNRWTPSKRSQFFEDFGARIYLIERCAANDQAGGSQAGLHAIEGAAPAYFQEREMDWLQELFNVEKPIIGMCHLLALPGDPDFDRGGGMQAVIERARHDIIALQRGGVDAVMFSNEASLPYMTEVAATTVASMARVIGELRADLNVPFGVDVLWDPIASLDLAAATEANFAREIFTGVYASDFGLWSTDPGRTVRHQHAIGAQGVRLFFNIVPEAAVYLSPRQISDIARSTAFNARPDALCVSGLIAGDETSTTLIRQVKEAVPHIPVFANTGVHAGSVQQQLSVADGAIVGTTFKREGRIWNSVDTGRVRALMDKVQTVRAELSG
jgi:membrane complex biogenesis BtpA family protein